MVDQEVVKARLLKLEEYINDLKDYQNIKQAEYKQNKLTKRFVERTLHLAIESCLDIGSHIISDERLGTTNNNADIMKILADNDIIKKDVDTYIKMAKFRNVIVHDYANVDPEIIHHILTNNVEDLKNFLLWIRDYIA